MSFASNAGIRLWLSPRTSRLLFIDIYMLSSIIEGGGGCGDMVVVRGEM